MQGGFKVEGAGPYFRSGQKITVYVAPELRELIPGYLANRRQEVGDLRQFLHDQEYSKVRIAGHQMKGHGSSYGFEVITRFGEELEECAKRQDQAGAEQVINQYDYYLKILEIRFHQ